MVELFVNSDYDDTQGLYTEFDMGTMQEVVKNLVGEEERKMILIDMNQVCISNLMMQIGSKTTE